MRRWSMSVALLLLGVGLAGCEPKVDPDPRPTGLGEKRFRMPPEGASEGGASTPAAEEDAALEKSSHPVG